MGGNISKRLSELERLINPEPAPVVIIKPGDKIPEGAQVVIIDDIPEEIAYAD